MAAGGLLAATLVTACSQLTQTLTVDFVYVASAKAAGADQYGEINVYEINSESGRMRQIPTSPFPSAGRNPVAEAISSDYQNLFVVNQDDNTIVQFVVGSDGKLYPFNTVNTPGIFPLAVAANKSNLFVVDTYQPLPLCSTAEPCSGSIGVLPLTAGGSASAAPCTPTFCIGSPAVNGTLNAQYWPLALSGANASHIIVPTAVNVLATGSNVYVTAYNSTVSPAKSDISSHSVSDRWRPDSLLRLALSRREHSPSALASDSTNAYVYVTDYAGAPCSATPWALGSLTAMTSGMRHHAFPSGNEPTAIVVIHRIPLPTSPIARCHRHGLYDRRR